MPQLLLTDLFTRCLRRVRRWSEVLAFLGIMPESRGFCHCKRGSCLEPDSDAFGSGRENAGFLPSSRSQYRTGSSKLGFLLG
jgi:hypothetical protein